MKVLITWKTSWLDEETIVSGFGIVTQAEWKKYKAELDVCYKELVVLIGTDGVVDYRCAADLLRDITATPHTDIEAAIITEKIGESFGFTDFFHVLEGCDDDD